MYQFLWGVILEALNVFRIYLSENLTEQSLHYDVTDYWRFIFFVIVHPPNFKCNGKINQIFRKRSSGGLISQKSTWILSKNTFPAPDLPCIFEGNSISPVKVENCRVPLSPRKPGWACEFSACCSPIIHGLFVIFIIWTCCTLVRFSSFPHRGFVHNFWYIDLVESVYAALSFAEVVVNTGITWNTLLV